MRGSRGERIITKREIVYKTLRGQIHSGQLMPGARLIELELANEFHVSRTVVREVIRELAFEGLVELLPYRGAAVARVSVDDLEEVYRIQQDLEGLAAYLATTRLSERQIGELQRIQASLRDLTHGDAAEWQRWNIKFHRVFMENSGNSRLVRLIEAQRDHFARYWLLALTIPGNMEDYVREHDGIIAAVKARKPLLVRHLMEKHLAKGARQVLEIVRSLYPPSSFEQRGRG